MNSVYLLVTMNEYKNHLYYFLHGEIKDLSIKELNNLVVRNIIKNIYDKFSQNNIHRKIINDCLNNISKIIDKNKIFYSSNFYPYILKISLSDEEKIIFNENDQNQNLKLGFINKNLLLQRRTMVFDDQTSNSTPFIIHKNRVYFIVKNTSFYGKIRVRNINTNVENIYICKNEDIYVDKNFIVLNIILSK